MMLRPYQIEVAKAVIDSAQNHKGLTFSVEIARQGGKNELSAHLELALLTAYIYKGGTAIKASPTFKPQTIISMERLRQRLDDLGFAGIWHSEMGYIIRLGNAREVFLSAEETSNVVGHTADILLEIDESQDISKEKYTKEFRPMGSATNVTTVHYGTTWDDSTLLEEIKQTNLELERTDGVKRHFRYDWQEVAKYNPAYAAYVESERTRLGDYHPLFLTQYALQPIHGGGHFLSIAQRNQLLGTHPPQFRAEKGKVYVAGIDLAGESEIAEDAMLRALKPRQDSTVITIAELEPSDSQPSLKVLCHYWWTGKKHPELYLQMVDILKNTFGCRHVVVDATGVGEPVASFLQKSLGSSRVAPFKFTQASKSELAFMLLAFINSGRLKLYQNTQDTQDTYTEFLWELEHSKQVFRPNQTMNFYVDPSEGHDDFLMSMALCCHAVKDWQPKVAKGGLRNEH